MSEDIPGHSVDSLSIHPLMIPNRYSFIPFRAAGGIDSQRFESGQIRPEQSGSIVFYSMNDQAFDGDDEVRCQSTVEQGAGTGMMVSGRENSIDIQGLVGSEQNGVQYSVVRA